MQTKDIFIVFNNTTGLAAKRNQENEILVIKYSYRNVQHTCGTWVNLIPNGNYNLCCQESRKICSVFQSEVLVIENYCENTSPVLEYFRAISLSQSSEFSKSKCLGYTLSTLVDTLNQFDHGNDLPMKAEQNSRTRDTSDPVLVSSWPKASKSKRLVIYCWRQQFHILTCSFIIAVSLTISPTLFPLSLGVFPRAGLWTDI